MFYYCVFFLVLLFDFIWEVFFYFYLCFFEIRESKFGDFGFNLENRYGLWVYFVLKINKIINSNELLIVKNWEVWYKN